MHALPGRSTPYGSSKIGKNFNLSVYSAHADAVQIAIFLPHSDKPIAEFPMHKTDVFWHVEIEDAPTQFEYALRVIGPSNERDLFKPSQYLLDPYAKCINTPYKWGEEQRSLRAVYPTPSFDWENDTPLHMPIEETIIYEMHIRAFTNDPSSMVASPGTFLGCIEKIPYLKKLGVTAVELMPIYEFNERSHRYFDSKDPLYNFWGYSTVSFFAPMNRYASSCAVTELKHLIKEFHKAGIEVFLDVVYNHTNEGDSREYYESFRGIDNSTYYMLTKDGHYFNYSGCGNTVNCNHPWVRRFIIDSLVYWVEEFHVDGFRFDLASIMTRGEDGSPLKNPPLIEEMCSHPSLLKTKLIAEAWDCGGLYQVGTFPRGDRFSEWNGIFRDTVRKYIRGERHEYNAFKDAFLGSPSIYGERGSNASINFVTAHDGFTLYDTTAYNEKHNELNREDNQDGHHLNESWNCGVEGETIDPLINALRKNQYKNFMATLLLAKGVPMLFMGDEYGHTRYGNNNAWCHDNFLNYFLWNKAIAHKEMVDYVQTLIELRKKHCRNTSEYMIHEQDDPSLFLCTINGSLFFGLNISEEHKKISLPHEFIPIENSHFTSGYLAPHASLVAEKKNIC